MITRVELESFGFRPISDKNYGKNGLIAFVTPYMDAVDEFFKVELKEDPRPPDCKGDIWVLCYTKEDVQRELESMTYYLTLSAARRGTKIE